MGKNKFPTTQAGIEALLNEMIDGFTEDATDFPAPPVTTLELKARQANIAARRSDLMTAKLAYETALDAFQDEFEATIDDMKTDIKYAELVAKNDNKKLERIGWAARGANTPQPPPTAPLGFEVLSQGRAAAHFDWKSPKGGGKAKMYDLILLDGGAGGTEGKVLKSTVDTEITVDSLPTGTLVFAVVAVNEAGRSAPSSPVTLYF